MKKSLTYEEFQAEFAKLAQKSYGEASPFAKEIAESPATKNPQTKQAALLDCAVSLFYGARYDEAEKLVKGFIFDYQKYHFRPFYVDCFELLALVQLSKKRIHLAIFYAQQALELALEKKCSDKLLAIYSNLAAPYHELKDYPKCLDCLDKALAAADKNEDPSNLVSVIYNRSETLLCLGRYEESREAILQVEAMAKQLPVPPFMLGILPLCKAEIALALHEKVDLHAEAMSFLKAPYQNDPEVMTYLLDSDESLFNLLLKNNLPTDAKLYLDQIKMIQAKAPSLTAAIFIAKAEVALAEEEGDKVKAGERYGELARLYEKQNDEFAADFEEITKLHFDFVRVSNAYQKAQKRARRLLEESDTDALTTLPNRRSLDKEKNRFAAFAKKKPYFVLALLDYDHFKEINDNYGYQAGDAALRLGGELFKKYASPFVKPFRYGGDEFMFALVVSSPEEAESFFKKLQSEVAAIKLKTSDGERIPLSCCIGYELFPGTFDGFAPALREVTEAIHSAKRTGRGRIVAAKVK
jgi:diguanylate cyclase (GGDEF)-like protein